MSTECPTPIQKSTNSKVFCNGDNFEKVSQFAFTLPAATALAGQMREYSKAFLDEPLQTPKLLEVDLVKVRNGFRIRQVVETCSLPNLDLLKGDERQTATRKLVSQIASIPAYAAVLMFCVFQSTLYFGTFTAMSKRAFWSISFRHFYDGQTALSQQKTFSGATTFFAEWLCRILWAENQGRSCALSEEPCTKRVVCQRSI